jgi:flagellar basal body rod protein FlgC
VVVTVQFNKAITGLPADRTEKEINAYERTYTTNSSEETREVTDAAGNTGSVTVKVMNIDKDAPDIEPTYSPTEPTN